MISTGGVGRRALERAFAQLFGRPDACAHFRFDGMTDRMIARLGLEAAGAAVSEQAIDEVLSQYLRELEVEIAQADMQRYRVHAGVHAALEAARQVGAAIGLGTGNIRDGARLKLDRVSLYQRFPFGGFGCDHVDRVELIRKGAERGADALGVALPECRVVVIGDTPKDVAAAKGVGAECLGVGTGSFTPGQLLAAGATHAFTNLEQPGAIEAMLQR